MELTAERKQYIDRMTYLELLSRWRFHPAGSQWFQGETGEYFAKRMAELRAQPGGEAKHVAASKIIGYSPCPFV
jgi:hypothetical protein